MGKGKGGGSGGGGGGQPGGGALQVVAPPRVEMTLKVVLAVKQQTREPERRVVKSDGMDFLGQQLTPTYFRKR
ncbi:forkhead box protein D1 isoform X1 [Anopheles arabiensis]|uniref:forkhead box protein D1 isoform X1 n=1 Tax=Anopheles arabiensis TaxID=7173 RepID=UPI001AAE1774|nr:forkhead box protein D1 isoform X1 [Anopheles arabiensis]